MRNPNLDLLWFCLLGLVSDQFHYSSFAPKPICGTLDFPSRKQAVVFHDNITYHWRYRAFGRYTMHIVSVLSINFREGCQETTPIPVVLKFSKIKASRSAHQGMRRNKMNKGGLKKERKKNVSYNQVQAKAILQNKNEIILSLIQILTIRWKL